jgi:hypothetical protein
VYRATDPVSVEIALWSLAAFFLLAAIGGGLTLCRIIRHRRQGK